LMSLRYSHQAPRQPSMVINTANNTANNTVNNTVSNTVNNTVSKCAVEYQPPRKIMSAVRSAQRHQGGVAGPRPARGTAAELSAPSA
jgi:hypothetical protein